MVYLLFILTIFFPAGTLLLGCFGYEIKLISISAFAIIIAILSIFTVTFHPSTKRNHKKKVAPVLFNLLAPLSLVNTLFLGFACNQIQVWISLLVSAICCCILTAKYGKPLFLKIISLTVFFLSILPVGFIVFMLLTFGKIGQDTVVQTVDSPSGRYYAQVIDSDQGALGGNTLVDVYDKRELDLILFKIKKKPKLIYLGEWGEFEDMVIQWKDDDCLIINSEEHIIK